MRRALLVGAFLQALVGTAAAQEAAFDRTARAKEAEVRKLLEVTGAAKLGMQVLATMTQSMRQMYPQVPESVWTDLLVEFRAEEMTELVIPIYQEHLTSEDIRALIAFYETPIGRKMLEIQPKILADSMAAGQQWGQECARRVLRRLQERGYVRKASLERERIDARP